MRRILVLLTVTAMLALMLALNVSAALTNFRGNENTSGSVKGDFDETGG